MMRVVPASEFLILPVELVAEPSTKGEPELLQQLRNLTEGTHDKTILSEKNRHVVGLLAMRRDGGERCEQGARHVPLAMRVSWVVVHNCSDFYC